MTSEQLTLFSDRLFQTILCLKDPISTDPRELFYGTQNVPISIEALRTA